MTNSLSLEINGIDPVTVAAVDLIVQTLPSTRMRLVDSRRLSAELARLFSSVTLICVIAIRIRPSIWQSCLLKVLITLSKAILSCSKTFPTS